MPLRQSSSEISQWSNVIETEHTCSACPATDWLTPTGQGGKEGMHVCVEEWGGGGAVRLMRPE